MLEYWPVSMNVITYLILLSCLLEEYNKQTKFNVHTEGWLISEEQIGGEVYIEIGNKVTRPSSKMSSTSRTSLRFRAAETLLFLDSGVVYDTTFDDS